MSVQSIAGDRVLVVDDDDNIRHIVRLCLSDAGYRVREAANGEAALQVLGNFDPALILLDLRMPVMNGWEFARRYRTLPGPHAPIVAFVAALNAAAECAELGSAAILAKPFDLNDLLTTVQAQLPRAS